jgi:hypothetical protein
MKEPFTYPLKHPIALPLQTLSELRFPAMKGKYMRKFTMTVQREEAEARRTAGGETVAEVGIEMSYGRYMVLAEAMLSDEYGLVTARLILDEMDPEDVHEVVSRVGERFAGGPTTGTPA